MLLFVRVRLLCVDSLRLSKLNEEMKESDYGIQGWCRYKYM